MVFCVGPCDITTRPDNTFDFVWSLNILEHVTPMRPYLEEVQRVLKPGGLYWARCGESVCRCVCIHTTPCRYNPHWFSPRGHHIHKDMIQRWSAWFAKDGHNECADMPFEDDGKTVRLMPTHATQVANSQRQMPDWAHLYMTEEELQAHLRTTELGRCERLVQHITRWLFHEQQVYTTNKVRV